MSTITNARDRPEEAKTQEIKQKIKAAINSNETFLNFLKENKIYGRFIKNTVNSLTQDAYNVEYVYWVVEKIKKDLNPINCAFYWAKTSERREFWRKHDCAYIATIKNKEKY